jgi:hypothetical protein
LGQAPTLDVSARGSCEGRRGTRALQAVESLEPADVQGLFIGVWDANRKLDEILRYLFDEDDGEEEEADPEP